MNLRRHDSFFRWVLVTAVGNVISAAFIALAAFVFFDYFYKTPQVNGFWEFDLKVLESLESRQQGQTLTYHTILIQDELAVNGSGDIHYHSQVGTRESGSKTAGDRILIQGHIEKNFFGPHELFLTITNEGNGDTKTAFHELSFSRKSGLTGTFSSTKNSIYGTSEWRKGKKYYQLNLKGLPLQ
jgi:hypothetical protein